MPVLTSSEIEHQNKLLRQLKIANFITCPSCHGRGYDFEDSVWTACDACFGSGRIYFQQQPWNVRDWWACLPAYKRRNYYAMFVLVLAFFVGLGLTQLLNW